MLFDGEGDLGTRRKVMDQYLKKSFELDTRNCNVISREEVGDCIHIFSHIRLRMYVELLVINLNGKALVNISLSPCQLFLTF